MKAVGTGKVTIWQVSSLLRLIYKTPGITRAELSAAFGDKIADLAVGMAIERLFSVPSADRPTDFYRAILGEAR